MRHKILFIIVFSNIFLLQGQEGKLLMGRSKKNITPLDSVYLSGYGGMYGHRYTNKVNDSLFCRVTALKKGDKRLVFISMDLIGSYFYEEVYEVLSKGFKLKPEEIFLTAIHTHSAPVFTFNEEDKDTYNYNYTRELLDKIAETTGEALSQLNEVSLSIGKGYAPIGVNRRALIFNPDYFPWDGGLIKLGINPEGITNNRIYLLKFIEKGTGEESILFEFACHARTQSPGSQVITGDFFGIAEQMAEKIMGDGNLMSGFAGPSGDIDPPFVQDGIEHGPNIVSETELLGRILAQELVRTSNRAKAQLNSSDILSIFKTIELPSRKEDEYISNDSIAKTPLNLTVSSIGDVALIGIGAEVAVEIGNKIREVSPFKNTFIFTHCNGGAGYLSPKEFYKERGYEVSNSPFGPESADIVIKSVLEMLYGIFPDKN